MRVLELFACSGGMAEGFRRAGLPVSLAIDRDPDACESYERNLGHRPVAIDIRDLQRLLEALGPSSEWDLLVADPPWSRAGHGKGTADERDALTETTQLIGHLRPRAWLVGNVPGLEDANHWPVAQNLLGGLWKDGYCVDFTLIDAADHGVPQRRSRPFWFGHRRGTQCVRWPARTHCDPTLLASHALPGIESLKPWVSCRAALEHLPLEELGAPVRLRYRGCKGRQEASIPDRPARVVGTSNLSDGNVLAHPTDAFRDRRAHRHPGKKHRASDPDAPAGVVTASENGDGNTLAVVPHHPTSESGDPSRTIRASSSGTPDKVVDGWPWDRPSTVVTSDRQGRLAPAGAHGVIDGQDNRGRGPNAIRLSERAAAILQGFPASWQFAGRTKASRWSQIGQATCPAVAEAVARAIRAQLETP